MRRTRILAACFAAAVSSAPPVRADEVPLPPTVQPEASIVEIYRDEELFFEGPVWAPASGKLFFTAFGKDNQQILRLERPGTAAVWLDHTQGVNGMFLSREGKILGAQAYGHRVMRYAVGPDGPVEEEVLAENPAWNQPNDVCQSPSGDLYFTDPDFKERKNSAVYHLPAKGVAPRSGAFAPRGGASAPRKIISDMPLPNGVIASNDGRTLYVSDSHLKLWRAYPVRGDGSVGPGRTFFNPDTPDRADPDGMTIDERGNLYLTGRGGVWAVSAAGEAIGFIPMPRFCSNVTFGGPQGRMLFMTCKGAVYSLAMRVRGGDPRYW